MFAPPLVSILLSMSDEARRLRQAIKRTLDVRVVEGMFVGGRRFEIYLRSHTLAELRAWLKRLQAIRKNSQLPKI
jgi:hypothetical protein